ncbi:beta-1,3-galactosyltransferase 5-like [Cherax quadricarinatus]|uniref:beta-1,3-galactosyltransferase 5-like n=1 Tax=Cherax quadricarinatus TaxID=27406 RepID=UPI002378D424|nr:beta-1,3-galactosyltransferase 5-like [Cherax quadricarinatus]
MLVGSRSSPRRMLIAATTTMSAGLVFTLLLALRSTIRAPARHPRHAQQRENSSASLASESNDIHEDTTDHIDFIPGWPYGLKINEPEMCKGHDVYLLNTVISNPSQVYHREMIRNMWGHDSIGKELKLKTVFIVGAVPSVVTQKHLQEESDKYKDIIQFDFLETRKNLTVKSLAAIYWFRAFCSNATWILKCDVDSYVNFWALLDVLKPVDDSKDAVCARSTSRSVCREVTATGCLPHYVVDRKDYSSNVYPPYCQGYAYVLHRRLADRMLQLDRQRTSPPFWLEDVYVTGLLPRNLHPRWLDIRRRSQVIPMSLRPEYHNGTFLFLHDLEGQIGQGATNYVWLKTLQHYNVTL